MERKKFWCEMSKGLVNSLVDIIFDEKIAKQMNIITQRTYIKS